MIECPDVDGHKCMLQQLNMPWPMTNRSIVTLYYLIDETKNADGSLVFIASSRNTESVVTSLSGQIKKNVVGNNIINYQRLTPVQGAEDGECDWVSVQCFDVGGSLP